MGKKEKRRKEREGQRERKGRRNGRKGRGRKREKEGEENEKKRTESEREERRKSEKGDGVRVGRLPASLALREDRRPWSAAGMLTIWREQEREQRKNKI